MGDGGLTGMLCLPRDMAPPAVKNARKSYKAMYCGRVRGDSETRVLKDLTGTELEVTVWSTSQQSHPVAPEPTATPGEWLISGFP